MENPNFQSGELRFRLGSSKLDDLVALAIVHWWFPKEIRMLVRIELEERKKLLVLQDQEEISLLLRTKELTKLYLLETNKYHTREFFGNVLRTITESTKRIKLVKYRPGRVTYPQWKRGFHDKGSRVPSEKWKPRSDYTLTELQNQIEQERLSFDDTQSFIEGLLI